MDCWVGNAHHVLRGHRSIVNQVRFNVERHVVCSSGVEKVVRLWSAVSPSAQPDEEEASEVEPKKQFDNSSAAMTLSQDDALMPESEDAGAGNGAANERSMFTHEEYIDLVRTTGQSINHDYR